MRVGLLGPPAKSDAAAWSWLIDVLALELAEDASSDRNALAAKLVMEGGYEVADHLDRTSEIQNARVRLAVAVASHITKERRRN